MAVISEFKREDWEQSRMPLDVIVVILLYCPCPTQGVSGLSDLGQVCELWIDVHVGQKGPYGRWQLVRSSRNPQVSTSLPKAVASFDISIHPGGWGNCFRGKGTQEERDSGACDPGPRLRC